MNLKHLKKASKFLSLLFILIITVSCAAVSPVEPIQEMPVTFADVETVEPAWQPFADGVGYFHGKTARPQLEFWALRIGLSAPDTRIVVSGGGQSQADGNGTTSTKVSGFVRDNNLLAGINAVPFDVISSREGQPIKNMGLVISSGTLIAPVNPNYDALVFYKADSVSQNGAGQNSRAAIVSQSSVYSIENIENAVGGFHQLLIDGEPAQRTFTREERHPRSAAGLAANGSVLYLLVIDGRRAGSTGATEKETALLLRALGCHDGINFDGGGSSTLALSYPDGKVRTVNTPIHGGIPGQERAVAGCLGIAGNK